MKLTITTPATEVFSVDVMEEMEIENLLVLCSMEAPSLNNTIPAQMMFVLNGVPQIGQNVLHKKISDFSIKDGDMILVSSVTNVMGSEHRTGQSMYGGGSVGGKTVEQLADELAEQYKNDPYFRSQIKQSNPSLAQALEKGNKEEFLALIREGKNKREAEERKRLEILNADPFDPKAQEYIESQIQQENIDSTLDIAMEHHPENFAQVTMLYIKCKANGYELKAFVDSGAQSTIMSVACAQRCNIMRLVDRRFVGIAKGVGEQKIIGKIHVAQLQIEDQFLPVAFTVLEEQSMDVLLGLDMLKRHQCVIDLKRSVLQIGPTETTFLPESELPEYAKLNGLKSQSEDHIGDAIKRSLEDTSQTGASSSGQSTSIVDSHVTDAAVRRLMEMGFSQAESIAALKKCQGDSDKAAISLLTKALPKPT